ncbi:MAG TPA: alanine--tRNA ligase [Acidimicrobiia bacterium]|nr:alanine--tRNA ligase [Acidimicrobiia bacterium]
MPNPPRTADELRQSWYDFFTAHGHTPVPSASVIPIDRTLLFTVAGMVPFKPYFVGDEKPPFSRATSVQKCIRAGGKHNDLDDIGRTNRHMSFFEMLGNFSFGDYFKADAIPWSWEFYTEVLGFDPDKLWVTVHETDDEAEAIWREIVGVPSERIQRLGEPNFWRMADTGPCGPSSEIFWDLGSEHGEAGGPAHGGEDRYIEIWNLVFMQYDAQPDGSLPPLPAPCVDTGAGLERNLAMLQGVDSVWAIDGFRPLIATAERVTEVAYEGFPGGERDVSLRILADHARTTAFAVSDGVVPSNEERGYVLRRIIRNAVRHAYQLGARDLVMPAMVDATVDVMGDAYPELLANRELVNTIVAREETRFRATLERGLDMLDEVLARGDVSGDDAFRLHDTLGFPIDLTREIAGERGHSVDLEGFEARMRDQRTRAREAHKEAGGAASAPVELYRELFEEHSGTEFTGRDEYASSARVLALIANGERTNRAEPGATVDVVLDRTPFYAESGGQVGDTGTITVDATGARLDVLDTQYGLPGSLVVHRARVAGETAVVEGDDVTAAIDGARRDRIRRNHTATHVLHWALREVLGKDVKQAGSLVSPERLRFDFSHHEAVSTAQLVEVERLANEQIIGDAPVSHNEMTKIDAEALGAIAFFGDKYGDVVRVLEAGPSIELCGGTHVDALGFIGPIKIVSEGSVGANLRRIEAVTGDAALARIADEEATLRRLGDRLRAAPAEVEEKVDRLLAQVKELNDEVAALRAREAKLAAEGLAASAVGGTVVARRDGLAPDELRQLAQATLAAIGQGVVALVGIGPDGTKAGIVVAVSKDRRAAGAAAPELAQDAARALGGGTGKQPELAQGGGPKVDGIDDALRLVRERVEPWAR